MAVIGVIIFFVFLFFIVKFVLALIKHEPAKRKGLIALFCFLIFFVCFLGSDNDDDDSNSSSSSSVKSSKISSQESSSSVDSSSISSSSSIINSSSSIIDSFSSSTNDNTQQTNQTTTDNNNLDNTAQPGEVIGDSKTHIYHTPDQHNYKINPANEVIFANEQQAIKANYHKSKR